MTTANAGGERNRRWAGNVVLLLLGGLALARLVTAPWHTLLVSNVTEFLPPASPGVETVAAGLRDDQAQLVFFAGRDGGLGKAQSEALADVLRGLPAVAEVGIGVGPEDTEALGRSLFAHRFELLFPSWLADARRRHAESGASETFATWLGQDAVARLAHFLDSPESLGFEPLIERDPLLLLPGAMNTLAPDITGGGPGALVWARLTGDPLQTEVQLEVLPTLSEVVAGIDKQFPDNPVEWFGAIRYAAETREEMQREVAWLNLLTLVLVGAMAVLVLRRPWQLVHLLVPVLIGLGLGLAVLTLVFDRIHVLSLVMGSILAGVAIDYGVHRLFHAPEPGGSDRPVVRALLISGLSTVAGYAVWASSSLLLARQTGVFVAVGLSGALLSVLLYTPLRHPVRPRGQALLSAPWLPLSGRSRGVLLALIILAVAGLWTQVRWNDSLEMLDVPHPELEAAVEAVAAQTGGSARGHFVFASGAGFVEAAGRLRALGEFGLGLAPLFPSPEESAGVADFAESWTEFRAAWRAALDQEGFAVEIFDGFEREFAAWLASDSPSAEVEQAGRELAEVFRGPSAALIGERADVAWLGAWVPQADMPATLPEGVARLAVRDEIEALIGDWRREQIRLSFLGIGVIAGIVMWFFPMRSWPIVLGLPLGAVGASLGVLDWTMDGLNLFHLAGALLAFCVTLDYVVFFDQCRRAGADFPASIRLSALTTGLAFGVLLLSQVEGVRSLGATLVLSVGLAIFGLELVRARRTTRGHD